MSEGIEVAGYPTLQGTKLCKERTEGWFVFREAVEGPLLNISSASFVKMKANSDISGFIKGVGGRHKEILFQ